MKVSEIMIRDVEICTPGDYLTSAARKMWERDIGALPVVDDEQRVVGMITDRDICMAAYTQGLPLFDIPVSAAMSQRVFFCRPSDGISEAEETMRAHQVRRLPVLDEDARLAGIISLNDLVREAEKELGRAEREITAQEITGTFAAVCQPRTPPPYVQ